jgi:hypothetical protein
MGSGFSGRRDTINSLYQQRHYIDTANTLREIKANMCGTARMDTLTVWEHTVRVLMSRFARDNPNFKPDKFMQACGYEGVK